MLVSFEAMGLQNGIRFLHWTDGDNSPYPKTNCIQLIYAFDGSTYGFIDATNTTTINITGKLYVADWSTKIDEILTIADNTISSATKIKKADNSIVSLEEISESGGGNEWIVIADSSDNLTIPDRRDKICFWENGQNGNIYTKFMDCIEPNKKYEIFFNISISGPSSGNTMEFPLNFYLDANNILPNFPSYADTAYPYYNQQQNKGLFITSGGMLPWNRGKQKWGFDSINGGSISFYNQTAQNKIDIRHNGKYTYGLYSSANITMLKIREIKEKYYE